MKSTTINMGVLGCGYWGPNLIRNFRSLPGCNLAAICDPREERLQHLSSLYHDLAAFTNCEKLLEMPGLTAVAIATPVRHHFPLAKAALLAGKHTFIEKPMAASSAECEELIEIAKRQGLILMVGHTFLYSAPVRRIVEIVRAGDLGEICYINSRRLNLGLFQKDINVAWDLAPHDISIILHVLGAFPTTVNCTGNAHVTPNVEDTTNMSLSFGKRRFATIQSSWLEPRKIREMTIVGTKRMIVYDDLQNHEDTTNMSLSFGKRRFATIQSSWLEPRKIREMTIVGTKRMIVYDDLQNHEKIRVYDVRVERPPHYDTFAEFHYSYHYGDSYIPHIKQEEPLKLVCEHFIECIQTGSEPITSGIAGLELVRILEAASASLAAGGAPISFSAKNPVSSFQAIPAKSAA